MAVLQVLTIVLLAGTACLASTSNGRIVGGSPTTIAQYPSIVQVDYLGIFSNSWSQSCAASILNSYYVLSAAHCFAGIFYRVESRRIRAGTTYRNTGGVVRYVLQEYNHPSYGIIRNDGDISVIRLVEPLTYSPVIQQATIISQGVDIPAHLPVVHAGWGTTSENGSTSSVLLDVTIYTVDRDVCARRYRPLYRVTENMICAGILDVGGADACQGDSGGPLYYGDIQIGVVSWGRGCARPRYPGVSTRIASYTDWIVQIASS